MSEQVVKKEPGIVKLVLVLFAISAITALLLGVINMVTAPAIAVNNQKKVDAAMNAVLPADSYETLEYTGSDPTVNAISKAGDAGYVVQVSPSGSFSPGFTIMVGVDGDGVVTGVDIVATAETSGLGANAGKPVFKDQFIGLAETAAVTKDGGTINALTGATITSRAVCSGVNSAVAAAQSMG